MSNNQQNSKADSGNYDEISSMFNTCQQITKENYSHLLEWIRNAFTILAMMNYPYPTNFLAPLPGHPVKVSCQGNLSSSVFFKTYCHLMRFLALIFILVYLIRINCFKDSTFCPNSYFY